MIKLCCVGLIIFVVLMADGEPKVEENLIIQVKQWVKRKPSSCGCNSCPAKIKPACRILGGLCISCSKSCNGETISGAKYCGGHCRCCVPHGFTTNPTSTATKATTTTAPTTKATSTSTTTKATTTTKPTTKATSIKATTTTVPTKKTTTTKATTTMAPTKKTTTTTATTTTAPTKKTTTTTATTTTATTTTASTEKTTTTTATNTTAPNKKTTTTTAPTKKTTTTTATTTTAPTKKTTTTTATTTTTRGKPTCGDANPPAWCSRDKPCKGTYKGIEYIGSCKLDCEATGRVETHSHTCRNGYKCCIVKPLIHCNISGTPYKSGKRFSKNCMMFECYNGTFTSEFKYNIECATCKARNDPHFTNFDKVLFDWHGKTDALLVQPQPGTDECPDHFVGMALRSCTPKIAESFATCWNTVYYKTQYGIEITVPRFPKKTEPVVIIEGNEQTLEDNEISILKGANGTEVPVIGFKKDDCLHILGIEDEGLLVVVCLGQVIIYAHSSLKTHLAGICGTWTGDKEAARDYYELRNGTQITRPNYQEDRSLPTVVGLDWEMPECLIKSRRRRDAGTPVVSDEKPCNASDSDLLTFYNKCAPPILATGNDNETKTEFINDCVFDQCIAISRANNPELAAGFFTETESMVVQAEAAANDTVQYPPGQPGTPNVTEHGSDYVVLVWAEPEDAADANILEYIIERRDLEGGNWTQCGEMNGNLTQDNITDVEEDHTYIFQVIAINEAGESEPSEPSESVFFASPYVPTTEASTTEEVWTSTTDEEVLTSTTVEEVWISTTEEEWMSTTDEEIWTSTTNEDVWFSTTDKGWCDEDGATCTADESGKTGGCYSSRDFAPPNTEPEESSNCKGSGCDCWVPKTGPN